jgi:anti-sigma regulatory factor (Ser/Thr protein kinase)
MSHLCVVRLYWALRVLGKPNRWDPPASAKPLSLAQIALGERLIGCLEQRLGKADVPVNEGLSSADGVHRPRFAGFIARQSGHDAGLWHELAEYPDGRVGVVVASCSDPSEGRRLRAETSAQMRDGADLGAVLGGFESSAGSVLAAVIDRTGARIRFGSRGPAAPVLVTPNEPPRALEPADGLLGRAQLPPGATVVLCTRSLAGNNHRWPTSSEQMIDELMAGFAATSEAPGVAVVLYRHPPAPLDLTVAAEAASLAVLRQQLRPWLAMTGADDEMCADVLLAVGEAATNAAEHAHDGTGRPVQMTLQADLSGDTMRFTLSDNGSWRPPVASNGQRGHGLRLMKALVDGVDVTTAADGTTVVMLKELAG